MRGLGVGATVLALGLMTSVGWGQSGGQWQWQPNAVKWWWDTPGKTYHVVAGALVSMEFYMKDMDTQPNQQQYRDRTWTISWSASGGTIRGHDTVDGGSNADL